MDEIEFDSLYAAARTYQDRRLGAGSLCDRCDHGHHLPPSRSAGRRGLLPEPPRPGSGRHCGVQRLPGSHGTHVERHDGYRAHDRSARGNRSAELSLSGADGRRRDVVAPFTETRIESLRAAVGGDRVNTPSSTKECR